ncbi:MAG: hypothetical protein WKF77_13170 [Planctomycetaceae bacterium]
MAIEVMAIIAIAIVVFDRFVTCSKSKYLHACFGRERLRHWHFQMFLDGALLCIADKTLQAGKITGRLTRFDTSHLDLEGASTTFIERPASPALMFHPFTAYSVPEIATEVFNALETLRFEHQAQYAARRINRPGNPHVPTMREGENWSETLAKLSLLGAVLIPIVQLILMAVKRREFEQGFQITHSALSASALLLIAVSATARAYRTGLTLPEELESYEDYVSHVEVLKTRLESADNARKQELLRDLELEAERELQRFLRMKEKASFLA